MSQAKKTAYEGGATRSELNERYELIPKAALDALARRLALGAERHGENNWKTGGLEFKKATVRHLIKHLYDFIEKGNTNDANTDAIICNAAFLCWYEEQGIK